MKTWIAPAITSLLSYIGAFFAQSELGAVAKCSVAVFFSGVAFICYSIDRSRNGGSQ